MASSYSQYPWSQGQAAPGFEVIGGTAPGGIIVPGLLQKQYGQRSFPPAITPPGTVASGGTVQNSTGYDCLVYLETSAGLGAVKVLAYNGGNATAFTMPGTVPGGQVAGPVLVPGPGALAASYSGTLNWLWMPL